MITWCLITAWCLIDVRWLSDVLFLFSEFPCDHKRGVRKRTDKIIQPPKQHKCLKISDCVTATVPLTSFNFCYIKKTKHFVAHLKEIWSEWSVYWPVLLNKNSNVSIGTDRLDLSLNQRKVSVLGIQKPACFTFYPLMGWSLSRMGESRKCTKVWRTRSVIQPRKNRL